MVMFTAITTAAIGLFYLAWIGILDLSLVFIADTYLIPQIVGGLILGVGFVVGGYCPGTSGVAIATGKVDALFYAAGGMLGIFIFGEIYPYIESFFNSSHMGTINLPTLIELNYGLVLLIVIILAIVGFTGAEWIEKYMAKSRGGE